MAFQDTGNVSRSDLLMAMRQQAQQSDPTTRNCLLNLLQISSHIQNATFPLSHVYIALPSKHTRTFTSLSDHAVRMSALLDAHDTFGHQWWTKVTRQVLFVWGSPTKQRGSAYESPQELQRRAKERMTQCIQSTKTVDCYNVSSERTRVPFSVF